MLDHSSTRYSLHPSCEHSVPAVLTASSDRVDDCEPDQRPEDVAEGAALEASSCNDGLETLHGLDPAVKLDVEEILADVLLDVDVGEEEKILVVHVEDRGCGHDCVW
eukprot:747324-Hanusia_phi.AAC.1